MALQRGDLRDHDALPLPNELVALGVLRIRAVAAVTTADGGLISVQPRETGGFYDTSAVTRVAAAEVAKEDNRTKLQVPQGQRAELFVWLDVGEAAVALLSLSYQPFVEQVRRMRLAM